MKKILTIIAAVALPFLAFAQTSIKVQAPNLVGVNEQFNVTFIISGENSPSDFQWEAGNDFQLVWGPQKGSSTSVSIINGSRTKSSQTTYTYILLPKNTGRFQLAPATATVKGEKIVSTAHSIEVVTDGASSQGSQQPQGGGQSQGSQGGSSSSSQVSADDMFLRLSFSKTSAMVGETISATLKLYQRVNIAGFEDAKFPTFNGFWSQEVQAPTNIEFHRESVGDKIYNAAVLRSWNLVPQQAGDVKIDGAELVCLVNVRTQRPSTGSIFDSFFQDDYQTVRKRVSTSPVTIHVSGLPAGAPESFGGGVGNFKMNVELTKDALRTHDAASLKVTVTGTGNTSLLEAPKVNFPPDFEVYDVKTTDVSGGKMFEYPFIPRSHGQFSIDPVEYSYFDISSRKYVTLRSQPLEINVERGNESASDGNGQIVNTGVARKDVRDVGSDIRFIETKAPSFKSASSYFLGSVPFWILLAVLILGSAGVFFGTRKLAAMRADVAGSKNRGATKMARKRLSRAGEFLKGDLYTAFYEELHKALLGFVSDKLNMDATDMTKENISERLIGSGVSEKAAGEFVSLIDACEFARYSPSSGHEAMNSHYESAVSVISEIDSSMKKPHRGGGSATVLVAAILMLSASFGADAADAYTDSLWVKGVNAYTEGDWALAAQSWKAISDLGIESDVLCYNLGNACYKGGDIAHAILYYERALKINPSYSAARYNLEFAQESVQDKIEAIPEFFLKTWMRSFSRIMSSNAWAAVFLVLLAAALAMGLLFLLGRSSGARRTGFILATVFLVLSLAGLGFSASQKADSMKADSAVVTRAVTSVKSSPGSDSSKDLFVLHEGTKVKLLDEVGSWRNIELSDGRQGWMQSSDLEVI